MAMCPQCLGPTRVFGVCVACNPKPGGSVTDPVLRWFLDVLAAEPEHTLEDFACELIQSAAVGIRHEPMMPGLPCHREYMDAWLTNRESGRGPAPAGDYVGVVDRMHDESGCVCTSVKELGLGEYGMRYLITFTTVAGAVLVWFTGEGGVFDPRAGGVYDLRFKVKEHKPYNGVKQTVVQRVKEQKKEDDGE